MLPNPHPKTRSTFMPMPQRYIRNKHLNLKRTNVTCSTVSRRKNTSVFLIYTWDPLLSYRIHDIHGTGIFYLHLVDICYVLEWLIFGPNVSKCKQIYQPHGSCGNPTPEIQHGYSNLPYRYSIFQRSYPPGN